MVIDKNAVVSFHYRLGEPGKGDLENSHGDDPIVYLHGHHGLLEGLENALQGHKAGEQVSVTLSPEHAYGLISENAIERISINHVIKEGKAKGKFKPGMVVHVNSKNGPRTVVVVKVGLKTLDVDTNHPLAGKTLTFTIDIVDVRAASEEEIAHGHVHGAGGHHH
jgi:FKBP-type peptidyl-prolyl cis-trans isomerase SlyD